MRKRIASYFVLIVAINVVSSSMAERLRLGDLLVTDRVHGTLMAIDSYTGNRRLISGLGMGEGPSMIEPTDLVFHRDGSIYVLDGASDAIFRVDSETGNRTIISGPNTGSGRMFGGLDGIALREDGVLYVGDQGSDEIWKVQISNGNRTRYAYLGNHADPSDLAVTDSGEILYLDSWANEVRLVPYFKNSGGHIAGVSDYSTIADNSLREHGALLNSPTAIELLPDGNLFTTSWWRVHPSIIHIDTNSGLQTLVSSALRGEGPDLFNPNGMAMGLDGALYVADRMFGLYRVNPQTGDRVLISGPEVGEGAGFGEMNGVAVVVPEPSAIVLLMAILAGGFVRQR